MNKEKEVINREDKKSELGRESIGRLLLKLSIPATFGMVVNGLYNVVDTIFIGRGVGTGAIGGLSLAIPAQIVIMAFGIAIGQGAASVVSRSLGAKNYAIARRAAGNAFASALLVSVLITLLGSIYLEKLLLLLGATETLFKYSYDYLSIILYGTPFLLLSIAANNLLRAEGKAKISMTIMLIGAVTNIILDPFFIFVFKLGIKGAAWATVTGQFFSFLYAIRFFVTGKSAVEVKLKHLLFKKSVVWDIVSLGFPSFIRQSGSGIVAVLLNNLLGKYGGDIYIAAYGLINRMVMFLFMPLFGLVQGFQPIAGYNYGAEKFDRVRKTLKIAVLSASIYTTGGFLLLFFLPGTIAGIFTSDGLLIETVKDSIRIIIAVFPLIGMQIIGSSYFTVIGKKLPSLILNLSRQFFILIPLLLILPHFFGIYGILTSFPVSDFLATLITLSWLLLELKHLDKSHRETLE